MDSREIASIRINPDSPEEGLIVVRVVKSRVGLCLSLREDGDVELILKREECAALARALGDAFAHLPVDE